MKTDQIASMQNPVNDLPSDIFSSKVFPSGRTVNVPDEWKEFLNWQKGNKYFGKYFSILGDDGV